MRLLRKFGVIASSVAMLATMGVGLAAGSASAATAETWCVFINNNQPQYVCALHTATGKPIVMALAEATVFTGTNNGYYGPITMSGSDLCMQGFADKPYNNGWTVALETCADETGQFWRAVSGPTVYGYRTYYWVNDWNPAYCLAWDQSAGTLFANTCRNAWYQQFASVL